MRLTGNGSVVGVCASMFIMAASGGPMPAAGQEETSAGQGALAAEQVDTVQREIRRLLDNARGWARMGYFDRTMVELAEAGALSETINGRIRRETPRGPVTDYSLNGFGIENEFRIMRLRQETHEETIARFGLPRGTLSDFKVIPLSPPGSKPRWMVVYTVAPKDLTPEDIAINPAAYHAASHVPGSRSCVAVYTSKKPERPVSETVFELMHTIDVPRGFTPFYVDPASGRSGVAIVHLIGRLDEEKPGPPRRGGMLLRWGRLVELTGGPCDGPAVVVPGRQSHLKSIASLFNRFCALKDTSDGAVLAVYGTTRCMEVIRFKGERIAEYTRSSGAGERPETLFPLSDGESIDRRMALKLAGLYRLRAEMDRGAVVTQHQSTRPSLVEYDEKDRQWRVRYGEPRRPVISGSVTTIVLDEYGRRVSFVQTVVPR